MFTAFLQIADLVELHQLGFFLTFFLLSWLIHIIKLNVSSNYKGPELNGKVSYTGTVLVPVYNEKLDLWREVLSSLNSAVKQAKNRIEVIVIVNGPRSKHADLLKEEAEKHGYKVIRQLKPSKRLAIYNGAKEAQGDITYILDSDTIMFPETLEDLSQVFYDPNVGGAMPKQKIFDRNRTKIRMISDWLEDVRFNEIAPGQSIKGAVSCLCGRLLAIRTNLLKEATPLLIKQKFLGSECISGDDRFLTSFLLKNNYKTLYCPNVLVYTDAPDTLKQFMKQRLRWSRTSLRETILSLNWLFRYPYTAFTVIAYAVMKWLFFAVIVMALLSLTNVVNRTHYYDLGFLIVFIGTVVGFFFSGYIRQFRHLKAFPEDFKNLLFFVVVSTFILTPVEWWGNITLKESGWMTRKVKK